MQTGRADQSRYLKLLPYAEVKERIVQGMTGIRLGTEVVPAGDALGRVCAEDVKSTCDVPARSVSAMDGYAVSSSETRGASPSRPIRFLIKGALHPESSSITISVEGRESYYVSTGAPIPQGADCVVRVENTRLAEESMEIIGEAPARKNVTLQGEDVRVGQTVAAKGTVLNPAKAALLISAEVAGVRVFRSPRVGILSIGGELRTLRDKADGKTVNNYANLVSGYLVESGARPVMLGVAPDSAKEIAASIRGALDSVDMVITIGGSSVGTRDFAVEAVESSFGKTAIAFHGVRIVPIRPTGLAIASGRVPIAIVPGHAVSAALSYQLVVLPVVNLLTGLPFEARMAVLKATLSEGVSNGRAIDALYLVRLSEGADDGELIASPLGWGSNVLSKLAEANGFIHLKGNQAWDRGDRVRVRLLGQMETSRISLDHR